MLVPVKTAVLSCPWYRSVSAGGCELPSLGVIGGALGSDRGAELMVAKNPLLHRMAGGRDRGGLLFFGSMTPHDPVSGEVVETLRQDVPAALEALTGRMIRDVPLERAYAQTWCLYSNLESMLAEVGRNLGHLVRQRIFLRDIRDCEAVERVMDHWIPGQKPATTILAIPSEGLDPRVSVQMDAIALDSSEGDVVPLGVYLPELDRTQGRYPQATRAGQFLFLSNTTGTAKEDRERVFEGPLGKELEGLLEGVAATELSGDILVQSAGTLLNLESIIQSQGGELGDILKLNGWFTFSMRDFGPVEAAREVLFRGQSLPTSSSVGVHSLPATNARIGYDAVAVLPGNPNIRKSIDATHSQLSPMFVEVASAGPYAFTCGDVPIDLAGPSLVDTFSQLPEEGRLLGAGRPQQQSGLEAQTWYVYMRHSSNLGRHDRTLEDVVHQTVYLTNPAELAIFERIAVAFLGSRMPPTTFIPITETSPFSGAQLEVELILATQTVG